MPNTQTSILLVDDDRQLCQLLAEYLAGEGFAVQAAHDGRQALDLLRTEHHFDALVLDIMMPMVSGLEVLKEMRQFSNLPVIMLTGRGDDIDRILGLEMGADDYLGKPCNPRELSARLKAVLRRTKNSVEPPPASAAIIRFAGLQLDPAALSASLEGESLQLTAAEFRVLQLLVEHAGHVLSKEFLTEQVLQRKLSRYDRSIDVHVSRIRQKLGQAQNAGGPHIKAIRGMGYQLLLEVDDEN
jgi:DNA-binding response OmpR family regulator